MSNLLKVMEKYGEATQGGSICIHNNGLYLLRFLVSFSFHGERIIRDSGDFPIGTRKCVEIPKEATDIHLGVHTNWGLWYSEFYHAQFPTPVTKCYVTSGTLFNPGIEEVPCK